MMNLCGWWFVKEARACFVQAATTSETFGKSNAVRYLVALEFP